MASPYVCAFEPGRRNVVHALHRTVGALPECGRQVDEEQGASDFPPPTGACPACVEVIRRNYAAMEHAGQ